MNPDRTNHSTARLSAAPVPNDPLSSADPVLEAVKRDAVARAAFGRAMRDCPYGFGDARRVAFAEKALRSAAERVGR